MVRGSRYADIISPERLRSLTCTIVGAGAVGYQVARNLCQMGVGNLIIFDDDKVSVENLGPQGYPVGRLGDAKTYAARAELALLNPDCRVTTFPVKFENTTEFGGEIVMACVDSIMTRRVLWEAAVKARTPLFVDARMSAEAWELYALDQPELYRAYEKTLFPASEAYAAPCQARSTNYCASIVAGFAVAAVTKWARGFPAQWLECNIMSGELNYLDVPQETPSANDSGPSGRSSPASG